MIINKQFIKVSLAISIILISTIIIYQKNNLETNIALVSKDKSQLKYISGSEITQVSKNDGEEEINKKTLKGEKNTPLNLGEKLELELTDKASPNSIDKINTKILEDNMIINFEKPTDNGTNYEYIIKHDNDEKSINYSAKSEIAGYNYIVDNNKTTSAGNIINKFDNETILVEKLNWENDYYLHIRAIDGNKNCSENKTFKLDLPSEGVCVKYVDINTESEIIEHKEITGVTKDEYNVSNMKQDIENYKLINTNGDLQGKLKKDKIYITYEYAKDAVVNINYIDEKTGKQVANPEIINGYEGMEFEVYDKDIYGYTCKEKGRKLKMKSGKNNINVYYNEIPKGVVKIRYLEKDTENELSQEDNFSNYVGETYKAEAKNIDEYEFIGQEKIVEGTIEEGINEITFYYKKKKEEGIENMDSNEFYENDIIDELIGSLDNNNTPEIKKTKPKIKNKNIGSAYDVIMNCDDSGYIIYYKRN